jgi:hypothetical protein
MNTSGLEANAEENNPILRTKWLGAKTFGFHILSCSK